jgi:hypothetical protein
MRFNFFLIAAFFVANAKDHHQQYPQLQQERRSVAGGFKRAARELHVVGKIGGRMVHGLIIGIVYWNCLLELFTGIVLDSIFGIKRVAQQHGAGNA